MADALKDMFNQTYLMDLVAAVQDHYLAFDGPGFASQVLDDRWQERALKERMRHITLNLGDFLPSDYQEALGILRRTAPQLTAYGFENMIFPDFVEVYGLGYWQSSIPALEQFTQQISAEFAVRPFLVQDQARMMSQMLAWADHPHEGVRRLASEGCRPRLPWGIALPALQENPLPILPILEKLKGDPSESVRRSVANNLNDISKDHPETVINLLVGWQEPDNKEREWIIQQALRTLIKQGHTGALEMLGYPSTPALEVQSLILEPLSLAVGGEVSLSFEISSTGPEEQQLMIDYVVYLMRANGRQTPKVFKLSKRCLAPGETIQIRKKHSFRPVTTRSYYPGAHAIEIQINGQRYGRLEFELTPVE